MITCYNGLTIPQEIKIWITMHRGDRVMNKATSKDKLIKQAGELNKEEQKILLKALERLTDADEYRKSMPYYEK